MLLRMNSKCITDLKVTHKIMQLSGIRKQDKIFKVKGKAKRCLDLISKAQSIEEKTGKLDLIRILISAL